MATRGGPASRKADPVIRPLTTKFKELRAASLKKRKTTQPREYDVSQLCIWLIGHRASGRRTTTRHRWYQGTKRELRCTRLHGRRNGLLSRLSQNSAFTLLSF